MLGFINTRAPAGIWSRPAHNSTALRTDSSGCSYFTTATLYFFIDRLEKEKYRVLFFESLNMGTTNRAAIDVFFTAQVAR
jgi:hypothetical protein